MTVTKDALYYPSSTSTIRFKEANRQVKIAADNIQDPSKFKSLDELAASGTKTEFDNLVRERKNLHSYIQTAEGAKSVLDNECSALHEFRNMIDDFRSDTAYVVFGNDAIQPAADFLTKLQNLLNSTNSQGRFIFGGKNQDIAPCGDLGISNLDVNGKPIANYTTATPDPKTIKISDIQTIITGIDASNPIFVNAIGAVNAYKIGDKNAVDKYLNVATELLYNALGTKERALETVDNSIEANKTRIKNNEISVQERFTLDGVDSRIKFSLAKQNLEQYYYLASAIQQLKRSALANF